MAAASGARGPLVPSKMSREDFVAAFGSVFEMSPWIAEAAFDRGIGPDQDNAVGLHRAMAQIFRASPRDAKCAVLRAHPDLAGKLAAARRLTRDSAGEQASAGLDALTDEERARFSDLNAVYTSRHAFPFIIAVLDYDKAGILAAFESRIANSTDDEFQEACRQVERIAALRLMAMDVGA